MELQLTNRVAIVTGASRGIGRAIAEVLALAGMRLTLVARSGDQLASLAATLPTECLVQVADLRDPSAPGAVVAATIAQAVAWLASPLAAYCQGTILDVDGGQTRTL